MELGDLQVNIVVHLLWVDREFPKWPELGSASASGSVPRSGEAGRLLRTRGLIRSRLGTPLSPGRSREMIIAVYSAKGESEKQLLRLTRLGKRNIVEPRTLLGPRRSGRSVIHS